MTPEKPRADDDWWETPSPMLGTVSDLNGEPVTAVPAVLVPDGAGGWREHRPEPKRRPMGFR